MSKPEHRIIIRRPRPAKKRYSNGTWKIAYADFMTAMMAFFLVMWLLSISSPHQLAGIADYFRMPLRTAISGGDKNSVSSKIIPGGGGPDLMRNEGELNQSEDMHEIERLQSFKQQLEEMIEDNAVLKPLRSQLLIDITNEGLRIQIVDSQHRPMFNRSSAVVNPPMRVILQEIGPLLNALPNKIVLSGHTDSSIYANKQAYSNWELSTDRANASRRELVMSGLAHDKVMRIHGLSSSMPLNHADTLDPINRRISVVVLNRQARERIEQENRSLTLPKYDETTEQTLSPAAQSIQRIKPDNP